MQDTIKLIGKVQFVLTDEFGAVKYTEENHNLVVTSGKTYVASRMSPSPMAVTGWCALGTGTVSPVISDTTLGAQLARIALTSCVASGSTITHTAIFGPGVGTGAISEAGLFNAASAGTMLARITYTAPAKLAPDTLTVIWTITVA